MSSLAIPIKAGELVTVAEDGALKAVIGEEKISILDMPVSVLAVQPGHASSNEKLKKQIGKWAYFLGDGKDRIILDDFADELRLGFIGKGTPFRNLFDVYQGAGKDNALLCASSDNQRPRKSIQNPPSLKCCEMKPGITGEPWYQPVCPEATWGKDPATGKPVPPKCKEGRVIYLFDYDLKTMVRMVLKSSGLKPWNEMEKTSKALLNHMRLKNKPINNLYIKATIVNEGTFVVPTFELVTGDENLAEKYAPLMNFYKEQFLSKPDERSIDQELDAALAPATAADKQNAVDLSPVEERPSDEELAKMQEEEFAI